MGWACANHHFAAIEAQLIILDRPPCEVTSRDSNKPSGGSWSWAELHVAPTLRRLERTLLAEPLRCKEIAANACRHPKFFFGAYDDRSNARTLQLA